MTITSHKLIPPFVYGLPQAIRILAKCYITFQLTSLDISLIVGHIVSLFNSLYGTGIRRLMGFIANTIIPPRLEWFNVIVNVKLLLTSVWNI